MPQIREYKLQSEVGGPGNIQRATAEDFGANLAKPIAHIGETLNTVGDFIQKREEQSDLSDMHVQMAEAHSEYTKQYREQLQNGTLDTDKFMSDFSDYMDKVGETAKTRAGSQYFQQTSAQLKGHFLETAAAGQAELAGKKAVQNYQQSLGASSSALLNDPSSFGLALDMQNKNIDNAVASGGLPAMHADELKNKSSLDLAKSSVRGWITLNPDNAKQQLNSGKWDQYINGDVKNQLLGEADQTLRAREVEQQRLKKQQEEVIKQQQTQTQNDFLNKLDKNALTSEDILKSNLDPVGSGSKEQFIQMLKSHIKDNQDRIKTDPSTFINLWDRVHLPDEDPQKLNDENDLNAYLGRGLTVSDINTLRGEIQGKKTLEGNNEAELKKQLTNEARAKLVKKNDMLGITDPEGERQYQKFLFEFLTTYNSERKSGKSAQQLLDPNSKDYLGNNINQYVKTPTQIIQERAQTMRKSTTVQSTVPKEPRKTGESVTDYLKRIGK